MAAKRKKTSNPRAHVFIDTSAIKMDSFYVFKGPSFDVFKALTDENLIKIHLSQVVLREWQSQLEVDFESKREEANTKLRKLIKYSFFEKIKGDKHITDALDEIVCAEPQIPRIIGTEFKSLLKEFKIQVMKIEGVHGQNVMSSYFNGGLPSGKKKDREDIPDAFIFEAARDTFTNLGKSETLHCIVNDKDLRTAISNINKKVFVYENIDEFIKSKHAKNLLQRIDSERMWEIQFGQMAPRLNLLHKYFNDFLEHAIIDQLNGQEVTHYSIPEDNQTACIQSVGEPFKISYDYGTADDMGARWVRLDFTLECEVEVYFNIFKWDAYDVPEGVSVSYGDPEKDHCYDADAMINVRVKGVLSMRFPESDISDLKNKMVEPEEILIEDIFDIEVIQDENENIFF